ncbi:hypothetical protein L4C31_01865 [Aliivibrio sifiae]
MSYTINQRQYTFNTFVKAHKRNGLPLWREEVMVGRDTFQGRQRLTLMLLRPMRKS